MTEPKMKKAKVVFTLETARVEILARVAKGGAKGATSPVTTRTPELKRSLYGQAIEGLQSEGTIRAVTIKDKKPKYFLPEFAPTVGGVAAKMEQLAARRHPALVTMAALKTALNADEKTLAIETVQLLETSKRIVRFTHGKSTLYAHAGSLRALLGGEPPPEPQPQPAATTTVPGKAIRSAYENLVRIAGFFDVEIATLQQHSGVPMPALKDWLLDEHRNGRAVFGIGDWSLADEKTRAGVIEMRGDRYLLVRLED